MGDADHTYGNFITTLINFVLIAVAVFFIIVKPVGAYLARVTAQEDATTRPCPECLSDIPIAATRCAHCWRASDANTPGYNRPQDPDRRHQLNTSNEPGPMCRAHCSLTIPPG